MDNDEAEVHKVDRQVLQDLKFADKPLRRDFLHEGDSEVDYASAQPASDCNHDRSP